MDAGRARGWRPRGLGARLAAAYAAVCLALWPFPVFGLLHAESSAVVAGAGCLLAAATTSRARPDLATSIRRHLAALGVPLAMLTATLLWRPNCAYLDGLGLFLILVPPSVLFGVGLGAVVSAAGLRWPRATAVLVVLGVALVGVVADLRFHPQLFTYSHVFGGVLGPIYDEELAVRPGLFAAKAQTLLWAVALLCYAAWRTERRASSMRTGLVAVVALGASYVAAPALGIIQTEAGIERVLSRRVDLGPVVLHLDPGTPDAEVRRLADEALYRFESLSSALEVDLEDAVDVYLYPDPDTKAALIGSRTTSVVPVWLLTPQVHMLADEVGRSLAHELVHVLAREFGMPVIGASPAIGLVEGLAVALEPPDGWPPPTALVVAGRAVETDAIQDPAAAVRATMSPGGFWTSRAGVAYTANGAFVRWLLDTFGPGPVKAAYRTGRFKDVFGRDLEALTQTWADSLAALEGDPEAVAVSEWIFSRPSLFEVRCPHHVPPAVRLAREGGERWESGDLEAAHDAYRAAVAADPLRLVALEGELGTRLALGAGVLEADAARAQAMTDTLATPATLAHRADVEALLGRPSSRLYQGALDSLSAVDAVGRVVLRRRAALEVGVLRALLSAPPNKVPGAVLEADPIVAALRLASLDRPVEAWRLARAWCPAGLEDAHVLRFLQARIAYRADAFDTAAGLYDGLEGAFRRLGPRSFAALVEDDVRRLEWRQSRPRTPSIFAVSPTVPDALASCAPDRPRRAGRLRAP